MWIHYVFKPSASRKHGKEAIVQLENTDATTLGPQEELLGIFYSTWKMKYHEIYRKTKSKHSLVQQKTDLNKPFTLGSATNSVLP